MQSTNATFVAHKYSLEYIQRVIVVVGGGWLAGWLGGWVADCLALCSLSFSVFGQKAQKCENVDHFYDYFSLTGSGL